MFFEIYDRISTPYNLNLINEDEWDTKDRRMFQIIFLCSTMLPREL